MTPSVSFSQPHLKKCFEGIKKLEMHTPGAEGRRHTEATGIFSPDGEYLPFASPVITESRPEEWLNKVEAAMFSTTKKHLFKTLEESRGSKKEKWLKDNPGQCVITAGQVGRRRKFGFRNGFKIEAEIPEGARRKGFHVDIRLGQ